MLFRSNDTATTEIYTSLHTLSLHDALPISLAVWLLRRLRYFEYNEALAGDLQEEFASGRSRRWYWRQTLMAIGRAMRHNLVP